jgi:hypothetical protein
MFRRLIASSPRELRIWCAYALILLAPGSFVVLPVLWFIKAFGSPGLTSGKRAFMRDEA